MPDVSPNSGQVADGFSKQLKAARAGSRTELGQLLQANRAYLLKIANDQLPEDLRAKGGASDLVQQSFLRAQHGFNGFHGHLEDELRAWLRQILLNNLANFRRHYRDAGKRQVGRERSLTVDDSRQGEAPDLRDDAPSPSSIIGRQQDAELLAAAMRRLPPDYGQVLILRYWQRLSFGEIGRLMDRSPNAVRKLWIRAIDRLHEEMKQ